MKIRADSNTATSSVHIAPGRANGVCPQAALTLVFARNRRQQTRANTEPTRTGALKAPHGADRGQAAGIPLPRTAQASVFPARWAGRIRAGNSPP